MKIMDNINTLLGDDLKASIRPKAKLKIAASCFSIYAYEALKSELKKIESVEFIPTSPAFVPNEVTDKLEKEHGEERKPLLTNGVTTLLLPIVDPLVKTLTSPI